MHGKELIMAGIVKGAAGLVGNTPLLEPVNLEKNKGKDFTEAGIL